MISLKKSEAYRDSRGPGGTFTAFSMTFSNFHILATEKENMKIAKEAHASLLAEYNKNDKRIKQVAAQLSKMGYKTPNKRSAAQSADTNV